MPRTSVRHAGGQRRRAVMGDPSLNGMRILIVEDEYMLAQDLSREVAEHGCTVIGPVPDVERGIRLLRDEHPDAALLDVNLAGKTVYELADLLLEEHIPFV